MAITTDNDDRALAASLYEQYYRRMYTIALHILRDPSDAEDAVEQTAIRIIRHIREFADSPPGKAEALIVMYTKSAAIDLYRKRVHLPLAMSDDENPAFADTAQSPDNTVIANDTVTVIRQYIEELKPIYRDVLVYKYFYERSDREIAELLHIRENAVRTRLTRARELLYKRMEEFM